MNSTRRRLPVSRAGGVAAIALAAVVTGLAMPAGVARGEAVAPAILTAKESVPPADITRNVQARRGDTFMKMLLRAGAGRADAHAAITAMRRVFEPRRLMPGLRLQVRLRPTIDGRKKTRLMEFTFEDGIASTVRIVRSIHQAFVATATPRNLQRKLVRAAGTIRSSLYKAGIRAGLAPQTLAGLIRLYSWDVDFQRDIQPGDSFDVAIERLFDAEGRSQGTGAIVYARLTLSGAAYPLYRFKDASGRIEYFDHKGRSAQKALMKTPIDGARLSSPYGRRRHPILGYTLMHRGIDFAAPRGTPIYAAGDGAIASIGRNGAYGRYIRIRHNATYATAYGHLHRYARKLRRGKRVRQGQVIGYVGSSGRSTGPHLHYEILVNGRQKNPMKIRLPSGRELGGKERRRFDAMRAAIDDRLARLAPVIQITRR